MLEEPPDTTSDVPPGRASFTREQLEAAAQRVRFQLLSRRAWFRATTVARELGVERDTVRGHAAALYKLGLVEQRQVADQPRPTFEWRPTGVGVELRRRIGTLLEEDFSVDRELQPVAVLVPLPGDEDLAAVLVSALPARQVIASSTAHWVFNQSEPSGVPTR